MPQFVQDYLHKIISDFVTSFKETNILHSTLAYNKRKINKKMILFFCWHFSCLEIVCIL